MDRYLPVELVCPHIGLELYPRRMLPSTVEYSTKFLKKIKIKYRKKNSFSVNERRRIKNLLKHLKLKFKSKIKSNKA